MPAPSIAGLYGPTSEAASRVGLQPFGPAPAGWLYALSSSASATASVMPLSSARSPQHQRQVHAEVSQWHDHDTGTARVVSAPSGPINSESDPLGYLRAHGLAAIDADGDEVMPSAAQARGLVGAYLDRMQREGGRPTSTVSFRDPQMRGPVALVTARRVV